MPSEEPLTFAIVICSDSRGIHEDMAGDALEKLISDKGWICKSHIIVRDEVMHIKEGIRHAADDMHVNIVLTCGGTGLSPRDVTPDATAEICERNVPGIAEAMRTHSVAITPRAMLSRALCMQRGSTLVINLPGSTKAATENWEGIVDVLPHAVSMMAGCGH